MAITYRDKLLADINEVPESMLPQLYAIVHTIKEQMFKNIPPKKKAVIVRQLGNAKGRIWMSDDFNEPLPEEIVAEFYK
jgi:Protein of unknown function (DUF2281)